MTPDHDARIMINELAQLLTAIARATLHDHQPSDFASIVTGSLAAAAANVGGPDAPLAARPGSWGASCIQELLQGAMSDDPQNCWTLITERPVVRLNVAELIEDSVLHPGLLGLYEAEDKLGAALGDPDQDQLEPGYEPALNDLEKRYADSSALYAQRFVAAVRSVATDLRRCD